MIARQLDNPERKMMEGAFVRGGERLHYFIGTFCGSFDDVDDENLHA